MNLWEDEVRPFRPSEFRIRRAELGFEILGHFRRRHDAFCIEQRMFAETDRDRLDDGAAIPIVAISCLLGQGDEVVGTVRIHQASPGIWWGSRLCVSREIRGAARIGTALIRAAVSTARAEGCRRFVAHVQRPNTTLFEDLGWRALENVSLHGVPHVRMEADLSRYQAVERADILHLAPLSRAAASPLPSPA